eukprot:CAMPEP_0169285526 /NCGR_PEP_ID=MMETSP1016-20121227/58748_1 /TAXON_ID=342587 /ORGANISM="Karlodinium micrum, Strain CCMP2283" /LENGTH=380 /DNA_ID=CAMNT_0009375045 /DNA_START=27 /DNA_END=1166 /DNA_ORIENTATION=+
MRRRQTSLSPPRTGRQPRQSSNPKVPPKAAAESSSPGHTANQPDTDGDEALALRLQMEEQAGTSPPRVIIPPGGGMSDEELALLIAAEESGVSLSEDRGRGEHLSSAHSGMSDEALAALLQEEERGHEPRANSCADIDDAELANLLQQEEEANARREQRQQQQPRSRRRPAPRFDPSEDWPEEMNEPRGLGDRAIGDVATACSQLGCGDNVTAPAAVASGCFAGCQIASCFGMSFTPTVLIMIGGGVFGLLSTNGLVNLRTPNRRVHVDEESEDEAPNAGLDDTAIENRTVDHVYTRAPPSTSDGKARADLRNDENKCMICMEHFADGDVLRTLPCLHRYHKQCVDTWLHRSSSCPICKRDVTDTTAPVMEISRPANDER